MSHTATGRSGPIRPSSGPGVTLAVTPASAGWRHVGFELVEVVAGDVVVRCDTGREAVVVPLSGAGTVSVDGTSHAVARQSVFAETSRVVYVAPGAELQLASETGLTVAIGSAPAEGLLPSRVVEPAEMRSEVRGGGTSYRQVVHTLAAPIPAERLIVYEVYVPRGTWAGWPPHRHDGIDGSPYLEETYYFRLDRPEGYVLHRNFCDGAAHDPDGVDFDEVVIARDGDLVLVPKGYHTSVTSPGSNMYFLNVLAGELTLDDRATPPCFHAEHTWIISDWESGAWSLPVVGRS